MLNIKEPADPVKVLLGLIGVNLGPLNILPNTKPPISEAIHPNNNIKSINLNISIFEKKKKNTQ